MFNFTINYNKPQNGATALFNGNISETHWNTLNADTNTRGYKYSYDALNRITGAIDNTGEYSVGNITPISYDLNGNILNMQRKRVIDADDNFTYTYNNTNKLQSLSGSKTGSFTYDVNGNMKTDTRKGITNITYNHLNLPTRVDFGSRRIEFTYDASGTKLRKKKIDGSNITTTDYAGGVIYENNVLQYFSHPEGYVKKDGSAFNYVYQYKDHLGNVRLTYADTNNDGVITPSTEIIEEANYFPFGARHRGYNGNVSANGNSLAQKRGFNGKILNDDLLGSNRLDWYDFEARNYDADLGRWMNLDPHADNYMSISPYTSFANNPLSFIDPDGKDILFWQKNKRGKWEQVEYSKLSKDVQKAISAFAETKEGYAFLKDFAKKGDKIGDIEFGENGKYSKHELSIGEHSRYGAAQASAKARKKKGDNKITLEMEINTIYRNDYKTDAATAYSVNIGHEAFVHFTQYIDRLIEAYDKGDMAEVSRIFKNRKKTTGAKSPEHSGYLNNKPEYKRMKAYLSQLKQVLNPKEVNKAIKEDKDNLRLYGN